MAQEIRRKIYDALGVEPASLGGDQAAARRVEDGAEGAPPAGPMAEEQAA